LVTHIKSAIGAHEMDCSFIALRRSKYYLMPLPYMDPRVSHTSIGLIIIVKLVLAYIRYIC
jgi:hypothetical protein